MESSDIPALIAALAKKDEIIAQQGNTIERLMTEMMGLRSQMNTLVAEISQMREEAKKENKSKPYDSPSEDEGKNKNTNEPAITSGEKPGDPSSEDEGRQSAMEEEESNDGFQLVAAKKSKKKRRIISSSDEETQPTKKMPASQDQAKKENDTGKSNLIIRQSTTTENDSPALPSCTQVASPTQPTAPTAQKPPVNPKIAPRPLRPKAIPPIIISNAGKFISISNLFKTNKINYSSAVVVRNGVKIFPCTETDFRAATKLLDGNKEPYFTFRFPEEKLNHVVLRGIPVHLSKEEISEDLSSQGFNPKNIIRWFHPNGEPMPMALVLLPKAEKDIYNVKFVCTFEVSAESQRSKPRSIQCYNCQDHGHAAPCCHIPPKCLKCGENHHTSACKKTKEEPPKCANCAGDHLASYRGCPRHPSQLRPKKQSTFRGWGTQDNSRLAPKLPTPQSAPTQASNDETPFNNAQLAQISELLSEQLKTFMTTIQTNGRP